ncbi:hypothetical protein ACLESD_23075 [Pyxidicoccus sp. 3LFB2]
MGRWRTGTAGLALGVWTALGVACDHGKTSPPTPPSVEEEVPIPEAPIPSEPLPGDARWTTHSAEAGRQDAVAVASDGSGGVVLLGTSEVLTAAGTAVDPDGTTLTLSRHDGTGQPLWRRSFTPESPRGGVTDVEAPLLAVSSSGDIFVAGKVRGRLRLGETAITDSAFVAKFGPEGSPRWARATGPVKALLPEGQGELVVAHGLVVERYDAQGSRRWEREVPAMASATVAALDSEGGLVMAGHKPVSPFESHGFIVRLSPDGELRWEREVGPATPTFTDVSFLPEGGFLLTGQVTGTLEWGRDTLTTPCSKQGCYRTVFTLATDAYGEPVWGRMMDGEEQSDSEEARLAVDEAGGSAVVWRHGCGSQLARLSTTGEVLWQDLYVTTPCLATPLLRDVAFLPGGDVVGAGRFSGTRTFGARAFSADDADVFLQRLVP